MGRRTAVPLYHKRHVAFVEAIHEADDNDKSMASHLGVGTGARADTIAHTHKSWFFYEDGDLYYQIPNSDPCRKYGNTSPCGDCNQADRIEFSPKTPAGEGRQILISNTWTNPVTEKREYFGLRDAVESYFSLDGDGAPDGLQYGNDMLSGNGVSRTRLPIWVREIGAQSTISPRLRESRLREAININEDTDTDQIKDFGKDADGNGIPDIIAHDLRATFCTQLARNEVESSKAITKTGHENEDTMNTYIRFANDEISPEKEDQFY